MINGFTYLARGVRSKEDLDQLVELAKQDKHGVFVPTHPIVKDDKIVGYFSIGSPGVPIIFAWLSTTELQARESFHLVNMVENHVALNGARAVCFPIPKDSPFYPLMEKLGFVSAGNYEFFVKPL